MILSLESVLWAIADFLAAFWEALGMGVIALIFIVYFIAFAIGEGLGIRMGGKVE